MIPFDRDKRIFTSADSIQFARFAWLDPVRWLNKIKSPSALLASVSCGLGFTGDTFSGKYQWGQRVGYKTLLNTIIFKPANLVDQDAYLTRHFHNLEILEPESSVYSCCMALLEIALSFVVVVLELLKVSSDVVFSIVEIRDKVLVLLHWQDAYLGSRRVFVTYPRAHIILERQSEVDSLTRRDRKQTFHALFNSHSQNFLLLLVAQMIVWLVCSWCQSCELGIVFDNKLWRKWRDCWRMHTSCIIGVYSRVIKVCRTTTRVSYCTSLDFCIVSLEEISIDETCVAEEQILHQNFNWFIDSLRKWIGDAGDIESSSSIKVLIFDGVELFLVVVSNSPIIDERIIWKKWQISFLQKDRATKLTSVVFKNTICNIDLVCIIGIYGCSLSCSQVLKQAGIEKNLWSLSLNDDVWNSWVEAFDVGSSADDGILHNTSRLLK